MQTMASRWRPPLDYLHQRDYFLENSIFHHTRIADSYTTPSSRTHQGATSKLDDKVGLICFMFFSTRP
jgi:hypothetical protein